MKINCSERIRQLSWPLLEQRSQNIQNLRGFHSLAAIGIDEARFDEAIIANDESGEDGKRPIPVSLKKGKIPSSLDHRAPLFISHEKSQVEHQCMAIIDIRKDRILRAALETKFGIESLRFRRDSDKLPAPKPLRR